MIVGLFVLQVLTGLLLMTVYSPSTTTAWGSVWYIQTQVPYGWLIRGLHYFASGGIIVLLLLYGGQLLVAKLYRTPNHLAEQKVIGVAVNPLGTGNIVQAFLACDELENISG